MNSHFKRLNWLPPFLWRYPEMETPPGMVRRFWAPMARIGTGQHTSGDDMVLPGEERKRCHYNSSLKKLFLLRLPVMNLVLVVPVGIKEDKQDLWRSGNVLYPEPVCAELHQLSHRELQGTRWAFSSTLRKATYFHFTLLYRPLCSCILYAYSGLFHTEL